MSCCLKVAHPRLKAKKLVNLHLKISNLEHQLLEAYRLMLIHFQGQYMYFLYAGTTIPYSSTPNCHNIKLHYSQNWKYSAGQWLASNTGSAILTFARHLHLPMRNASLESDEDPWGQKQDLPGPQVIGQEPYEIISLFLWIHATKFIKWSYYHKPDGQSRISQDGA